MSAETPTLAPASGIRLDRLAAVWGPRIVALLPLIALLLVWEELARSHILSAFLLPAPSVVLGRIWNDVQSGDLLTNLGTTLYRAMAGFAIAAVAGVALGIVMARNAVVRWFFDPIVSVAFPMPKIAFLPIFMLWLGLYDVSKISMVVFNAIFPVITATIAAAEGRPEFLPAVVGAQPRRKRTAIAARDHPAGGAAANLDRAAGGVADLVDRRDRNRDADGRNRARWGDDLILALC